MSLRRTAALLLAALLTITSLPVLAAEGEDPAPGVTSTDEAAPVTSLPGEETASGAEAPAQEAAPSEEAPAGEEAPKPFADPDVDPSFWYYPAYRQLTDMGVDCAIDDGRIYARAKIDRYDFVRLLLRAMDFRPDRADPAQEKEAVLARAQELGILTPEQCTPEGLRANFCRYEMARITARVLTGVRGESYDPTPCLRAFLKDAGNCSPAGLEPVNTCYMAGVLRGSNGIYDGWEAPTRAEAMTAILRLVVPETRYKAAPALEADAPITRGAFITMLNYAMGAQTRDNLGGAGPAAAHYALAESLGYLPDEPGYTLGWALEPMTRFQMAALLTHISQFLGEELQTSVSCRLYLKGVEEALPEEYEEAAQHCVLTGIIPCDGPDGSFNGAETVTCQDACRYLNNLFLPGLRAPLQPDRYTKVIASYTTSYAASKVNSAFNSRLAAKYIGTRILQPGASLSFLSMVAPTLPEKGYVVSSAINNGVYVNEYGGGVCQTSSTLYAASLYAGLRIVRRYNHGIRSTYIDGGLDATVYYPWVDLVVSNPYDQPIKIAPEWSDSSLTFHVLCAEDMEVPEVSVTVTRENLTYTTVRTVNSARDYTSVSKYRQ